MTASGNGGKDRGAKVKALVHDLRNEVNVIGFACSALRHQVGSGASEQVLRSLDRIESSYARCAALLVNYDQEDDAARQPVG
ncbi:MAG TPA: hypothetical protein VEY92_08000 [Pseudoxanthomonas sp.]|nr:hypothetical protein [Pseudoxanthomonas sp.]